MNIAKLMKQAQEMQSKMQDAQASLAGEVVESSVGGGHVKVKATAAGDVLEIKISPEAIDPDDVEMLETLVLKGVQEAIEKGRDHAQKAMGDIQAGMGMPPGLGF